MKPNNQRGWGLTETLLTLGALSVMSLAIYAVFKPADAQAQVKIEQDNLRELSRAVDRSFGLLGSFDRVSTARLLDDDLAPRRMRRGGGLQTQWGAPVSVDPHSVHQPGDAFLVSYPFTRAEVCAGLASAMAGDAFDIRVNGRSVYDANGLDPAQAAERCADGNATMEFVFHSGLVAGQAVAAPPLILPPAPPSTSRPPSAPPVMDIPDNEGVDDAAPGVMPTPSPGPSSPPPAPPPVAAPPPPPPSEPIVITDPPPVPVTPPGTICTPPASWVETRARTVYTCPVGAYGSRQEQGQRTVSYSCPEAWDDPVESRGDWSAWAVSSSNCTTCPTLAPEAQTRWVDVERTCPAGQRGTLRHEAQERRTRSRSYNCPAGTATLPAPTVGTWGPWEPTGSTRNSVNTCTPVRECEGQPPVSVSFGSESHSFEQHREDPAPIPGYYSLPNSWPASAPAWVKSALAAAKAEVAGKYSPAVHGPPPFGYDGPGPYGLVGGTGGFCLDPAEQGGVLYWYTYQVHQVGPGMGSGGDVYRHTYTATHSACMSACEAEDLNP